MAQLLVWRKISTMDSRMDVCVPSKVQRQNVIAQIQYTIRSVQHLGTPISIYAKSIVRGNCQVVMAFAHASLLRLRILPPFQVHATAVMGYREFTRRMMMERIRAL